METESSRPRKFSKNDRQKTKHRNSRAKNDDMFRQRIGQKVDSDYRAQRDAKFQSKSESESAVADNPHKYFQYLVSSVVRQMFPKSLIF